MLIIDSGSTFIPPLGKAAFPNANFLNKKPEGLLFIEGPIERNLSLVNYSILFFGNLRNIFFTYLKRYNTHTHIFFVSFLRMYCL